MKKNLTPGTKTAYVNRKPLVASNGRNTGRVLALPTSIGHGEEFRIGNYAFHNRQYAVVAQQPLPDSWFVDLAGE